MAAFCDRFLSLIADDEDTRGGFDDVVGDGFKLVDFEDSGDLREQALQESEVAAGDSFDCGDCLGIGEVVRVEVSARAFPVPVENEEEFFAAECPVSVGVAEAAVELWVAGESLVDAGHADSDHRQVDPFVVVAEDFKCSRGEPFGFVDNEQFHQFADAVHAAGCRRVVLAEVLVDAATDSCLRTADLVHEILWAAEHFRGVENSTGAVGEGVVFAVFVAAWTPFVDEGLEVVPVGIAARRDCFSYAGLAVADADGLFFPDCVGDPGGAPVLCGHDEGLVHHPSSS